MMSGLKEKKKDKHKEQNIYETIRDIKQYLHFTSVVFGGK